MGNQLVGIAPSQIYPVEHYLTDHNELKFDVSLGSTRFFKVARAESQEGLIVVKVFAIHDPTLPLQPYKDRLDDIHNKLSSTFNCLPFHRVVVTEKAGLIMREYVKYSLYDRISTRPFLTNIEKRWITFQVLCALNQCHKVGVCHGDIKLENITVTSWNWVLLLDFASFKPTFLPHDNPADYSYFFDTSRRRTCYMAPERFVTGTENGLLFNETPCNSAELKPAMDIFSAGCALLELWNEGNPPFDLSQLLSYRSKEYYPQKHLDKIEDESLRALLASMIDLDSKRRLTAEQYLFQEYGKLFPSYFYTFLQSYMQIFSSMLILSPDEKILYLKKDINFILSLFRSDQNVETLVKNDDGLIIITTLVTSCIRGLHDCTSKLQSLEILLDLAKYSNEETILDRILPYIVFLAHDINAMVKVSALNILTQCLNLVECVPKSDANIFPEYVLPELACLAVDPETSVRAAYAKNLGTLAEISLRYLEQTQSDSSEKCVYKNKDAPYVNYEMELQTLHEMVQQSVSSLLIDGQAIVKQTLIESGITKLCVFFGKQKANDVLLSHMITFLNDKEDKELRGSFFDCIVGVSSYIGWHCSFILTPLLLQGLTDSSEFVIMKSINSMSSLTELGLITKQDLCELIKECCCFLVHPNLWIRNAVAGFISVAARNLFVLDVQCKIMPLISVYMKHPLIQIDRPELLMESLVNPIPRAVYDNVLLQDNIMALLCTLEDRKNARLYARSDRIINYGEIKQTFLQLLRRLAAVGMTDSVEEYLLLMSNLLVKIQKHKLSAGILKVTKNSAGQGQIEIIKTNGIINVTDSLPTYVSNLSENRDKMDLQNKKAQRTRVLLTPNSNANLDWNVISAEAIIRSSKVGPISRPITPPSLKHGTVGERSFIEYRRSNCSLELNKLLTRQQDHYIETVKSREWTEQAAWKPQLPPPGWKLRGSLVAHLHEHRSPITKLASIPDSALFASCSRDGFIRIWDLAKMEGKNIANRSKQSYKVPGGGGVTAMAMCENGQSIAAAVEDGSIVVLRIEPTSSRMSLVHAKQLNVDKEVCAVDVQYIESGPKSMLVYATLNGHLVGWDLRSQEPAWILKNKLRYGVITSFCIDSHHDCLALGTSSGYHIAWDLRFRLPIARVEHPSGSRIRKVIMHPTEKSYVISSVQGNNEVSIWNLETESRQMTLWSSENPPCTTTTTTTTANNQSVCAMQAGCIDRSAFLITGGTDQRVKFWNLTNPQESYFAIPAANDPLIGGAMNFHFRPIDGMNVIYTSEIANPNKIAGKELEVPRPGPEPPSSAHRDSITDLSLCQASQCFLLTASRDGVIKVWK